MCPQSLVNIFLVIGTGLIVGTALCVYIGVVGVVWGDLMMPERPWWGRLDSGKVSELFMKDHCRSTGLRWQASLSKCLSFLSIARENGNRLRRIHNGNSKQTTEGNLRIWSFQAAGGRKMCGWRAAQQPIRPLPGTFIQNNASQILSKKVFAWVKARLVLTPHGCWRITDAEKLCLRGSGRICLGDIRVSSLLTEK